MHLQNAHAAFRSGAVMGFLLSALGLLNLFIAIGIFKQVSFGMLPWGQVQR